MNFFIVDVVSPLTVMAATIGKAPYFLFSVGHPIKRRKKSRIRETKKLSTDADSSTNANKNPASKAKFAPKKPFFLRGNFTPFLSKSFRMWDHFFSLLFSKDYENLKSYKIGVREVGAKKHLNKVNKWKNQKKNLFFCRGNFTPFMSKSFQLWDHLFSILFPKDSEYIKSLDIELREEEKNIVIPWVVKAFTVAKAPTFP